MRKNEKQKRPLLRSLALAAALMGAGASLAGCGYGVSVGRGLLSSLHRGDGSLYGEMENKLDDLQAVIDAYYMSDDEPVSQEEMLEGVYKGYVDSLNEPYTVYYTAEEYAALEESSQGFYSGIGVVVSQDVRTGVISVLRPFEGSPGEEAGLLKDDVLYKVDGKEVTGQDVSEVVSWIKGPEGTTVDIEVYRASESDYMTFTVERRTIEVPMVEHEMLDNGIGHVTILEFEETTYDQFCEALDDLSSQGMKALVLDLRDNPGGLVNSAVDVLDRILPPEKLLVYTIDKNGQKEEEYSKDKDVFDLPMVVLINENSASASEIVSGCLQDYETAQLVGTTSFGKGIVQYVIGLDDGSAIKLTAAKYYTPEGRNIHGTGLEPDVVVEETAADEGESEAAADSQLDKAVEILMSEIGE